MNGFFFQVGGLGFSEKRRDFKLFRYYFKKMKISGIPVEISGCG